MGRIKQIAFLQNSTDLGNFQRGLITEVEVHSLEVEFLVDTGASLICLPMDTIRKLELVKQKERLAKTANGTVTRSIYSPVKITIGDRDTTLEVMEIPDGVDAPPLLGYLALEALDLYVDPKGQRLTGNPETDGKMMLDLF